MSKSDYRKTKTRLIAELDAMRRRVAELRGDQVPSESEERYRRLVQLLPDAVRVSCNGRVVYVNEAAARMFGADDTDQLIGRKTDDFVLPEDLDTIDARRRMVLSWDGPLPIEEQRRVRLDGTIVPVEISSIQINWRASLRPLRSCAISAAEFGRAPRWKRANAALPPSPRTSRAPPTSACWKATAGSNLPMSATASANSSGSSRKRSWPRDRRCCGSSTATTAGR